MAIDQTWGIKEASAWVRTHAWGEYVMMQLQEAKNAEERQQWLCVVMCMRAVLERCKPGAVLAVALSAIDEEPSSADPAGIAAMKANLDE